MSQLTEQHCEPCEGGVDPMGIDEAQGYLDDVDDWEFEDIEDVPKIRKEYVFDDFVGAIDFVDRIAEISEEEAHHPNLAIDYNTVTVTLWTHAIDGLSKNDFILAAKFDEVADSMGQG